MQGPAPFPAPPPIPTRPPPPAPRARRAFPLWAGILLGVVLGIVLLVAGGFWWGWSLFSGQATTAMNQHPVIQRCIGNIQHSSLDWSATVDDQRDDSFAFRVRGTRGSGLVVAVFDSVDADNEAISSGELHMDNGKSLKLDVSDDDDDDDTPEPDCS